MANRDRDSVILAAPVFFFAMLGHEVILEHIFIRWQHRPSSFFLLVTMFQMMGCTLLGAITRAPKTGATPAALPAVAEDTGGGSGLRRILKIKMAEWGPFAVLAVLVSLATGLSHLSLDYVSYPTKVLFKASKLIPTMIVAALVGNVDRFSTTEYASALLVCLGTAGFAYEQDGASQSEGDGVEGRAKKIVGVMLLTGSSLADALVPNLQERLLRFGHSPGGVMMGTNGAGGVLVVVVALFGGHSRTLLGYVMEHEPILLFTQLAAVGALLAVAVAAYTQLISSAGSVAAVLVSTLRKSSTMVLSYVAFAKPLNLGQVFSAIAVGFGIAMQIHYRHFARRVPPTGSFDK